MPEDPPVAWHLDRRVPIALILALLAQSGTAVWWASKMESRVENVATTNQRQDDQIEALDADAQRMAVGAATVNAQLQAVRESLAEMKDAQRETNDLLRQLSERAAQ